MAKYSKQNILDQVLKCPVDFIYLFASDKFIASLSGAYRTTVYKKNVLQRQYINRSAREAGENYQDWLNKISQEIVNTYGMKPSEILNRLASGQNVAGKNWSAGVYGVGATNYEGFSQNTAITVDKGTGKLMQAGKEIQGQTAVYSGSGKVVGYTATVDGAQFQSKRSGSNYYAGMYSTTDGAFNADGSQYQAINSESIYQSMQSWLPMIQQFMQWLISLFNISVAQPTQVVASQSDWIKTKNDSDTLLYFVAGAAIVALIFK